MGSEANSSTRKKQSENAQTQPRKSGKFDVKPLKPAKAPAVAKKAVAKPVAKKAKASSKASPYELKSVKKTRGDEVNVQTYKTTNQFIEEFKSLDDAKIKQLSEAWYVARDAALSAARDAARFDAWYAARTRAWSAAWSGARSGAWNAAGSADLAVLAKDKITAEQFEILTSPWTSCGLSLFVEAEG